MINAREVNFFLLLFVPLPRNSRFFARAQPRVFMPVQVVHHGGGMKPPKQHCE